MSSCRTRSITPVAIVGSTSSPHSIPEVETSRTEATVESIRRRGRAKNKGLEKLKRIYGSQKIPVEIKSNIFKVVSQHYKEWTTELGIIVRTYSPILCETWKAIPEHDKKLMFDIVADTFNVDYNDPHHRDVVEDQLQSRFREYRHRLKAHYEKFKSCETGRRNPYVGVSDSDWLKLCDRFDSINSKERSKINSENREKMTTIHYAASKLFIQHLEEMESMNSLCESTQASRTTSKAAQKEAFEEVMGCGKGLGHGVKRQSNRYTKKEFEAMKKECEDVKRQMKELQESMQDIIRQTVKEILDQERRRDEV